MEPSILGYTLVFAHGGHNTIRLPLRALANFRSLPLPGRCTHMYILILIEFRHHLVIYTLPKRRTL